MPYVGNIPAEKYAAFDVQHFTTSATTGYTLSHAVANENDIRLVINNVVQQPGASYAYTASGTTLTLSSATSGTDTMYCVFLGKAVQTVVPPAGSVGADQLSANAITGQTALGGTPADTDELLISDAGVLKRVDYSYLKGVSLSTNVNNQVATVTGPDALNGEANLTFDGNDLTLGNGNIVFGTAAKGVYLGVTSATASNLLDDYEEGNWTPNVDGTTSIAYDNRVGRYTKIGNTVFVECLLQWNSASYSSSTAVFTVTGLPFAAINIHYVGVPGAVTTGASFNWNNTESTSTSASIAAAATDSSTVVFNVGSSGENFSGSKIKNANNGNGIVQIAMTYRTTA